VVAANGRLNITVTPFASDPNFQFFILLFVKAYRTHPFIFFCSYLSVLAGSNRGGASSAATASTLDHAGYLRRSGIPLILLSKT
jgi:hypothetical protein